ncbi:sulfite exporter TauE/SafE family protein [Frigidibacter sp. ROC022]|uniref:sulfite exporter TauE/SafE family protein n=1 Tax=Frigidibacter sp. ROC022 TaxID=2971796 RepID=UPI00215B6298|nr:sulfite exporter TauE/SafE family protein [Frigidibacter sp. ROC022]MCR8724104.1 sulfite exporter TauE/SafE family protein [Frigidibacter sp. ROC022]
MFDHTDPLALAAILAALMMGGVLKGATGAGAPVIAVPVIAGVFDIRVAVVIMAVPNLLTNTWQSWSYRSHGIGRSFTLAFALAGAIGTIAGTVVLALLPIDALQLLTAAVVFLYVLLRLARPELTLSRHHANRAVVPVGVAAGVLQGAAGISAPISLSFLSAMRLSRPAFIATISLFFASMGLVQLPSLAYYGLMTWQLFGIGILAVVPLLLGMPLGAAIARRIGPKGFDRVILVFLCLLALRLIWTALH